MGYMSDGENKLCAGLNISKAYITCQKNLNAVSHKFSISSNSNRDPTSFLIDDDIAIAATTGCYRTAE